MKGERNVFQDAFCFSLWRPRLAYLEPLHNLSAANGFFSSIMVDAARPNFQRNVIVQAVPVKPLRHNQGGSWLAQRLEGVADIEFAHPAKVAASVMGLSTTKRRIINTITEERASFHLNGIPHLW